MPIIPLTDQAGPCAAAVSTPSTGTRPASAMRSSAAPLVPHGGRATALPRSTATRSPRNCSTNLRPGLPALDAAGSAGPAGHGRWRRRTTAPRHRAGEAADDDREVAVHGVRRQRDAAERGLELTSPQNPPGCGSSRTPSPPAGVRIPPATAAAEPPDEPPGVRSGCHGLRSCRAGGARDIDAAELRRSRLPGEHRAALVADALDHRRRGRGDLSANGTEAWVYGHPATSSSSLTPIRTPPRARTHRRHRPRDGRPFAVRRG